jgi:murein DD-endopeptidase MepM/ murein hydrolase activator NlpD
VSAKAAALVLLLASLAVVVIATATQARTVNASLRELAARDLMIPVQGVSRAKLRDNFEETHGNHRHEALDIMAARGTPVLAVDAGRVAKLSRGGPGGVTAYQLDPEERFVYYYAHLDRYARGLVEGKTVRRGEIIGYVGSTGNAPRGTPHLHFTIFRLGSDKRWWKGAPVNPYPYLLTEAPRKRLSESSYTK